MSRSIQILNVQDSELWDEHETRLRKYLMDEHVLKSQCYYVQEWGTGCTMFATKELLEEYLKSKAPELVYERLSELASYLVVNEVVLDVCVTDSKWLTKVVRRS